MATNGKEYKLAIRIAGIVDKSYDVALVSANASLKGFSATMNSIDGNFTKLDKGFNKVMSAGKNCFRTIATAAGVASVAVGAVIAASAKVGSDFEAEMATVQAISRATGEEISALSEKARNVAKNTVFSATEVGSAMEYMGMAGWKASQMMEGLSGVVSLAAASGEDMAMVSDIVTDSLTAMGEGADEATRFANIMAQAAMNSNTNVELMGHSLKYAAPVAGALEYSMEDLTIAIGLMASNGIKGSLAGTALRNMLTRMAKPTRESRDAMKSLGISLSDSEGNMYSLLEIMQQLRQNFAEGSDTEGMRAALTTLGALTDDQIAEVKEGLGELSAAEEAFYAAELGGQRGMSGLLAIANSSDEEFMKLTSAIYNAEGAAEQMSSMRLDNLKGDAVILKDTVADAGIEMYQEFSGTFRKIVQEATEFIRSVDGGLPGFFRDINESLPTIKRNFSKYAEPVFNVFMSTGKWIISNGDGIISVITGIGVAMATYKIFSTISHITTALTTLAGNPVMLAIVGIGVAIGALTTAITAYSRHKQDLIDDSYARHFGEIALTLEELQDVAESVVSSNALGGIKKALSAFDDLKSFEQAINDSVDTLNRMNWMIEIGMELDTEDRSAYKRAVQDYSTAVKNYAKNGSYAVAMNLAATFDLEDDSQNNIVTRINAFYQNKYTELENLGKKLNEAITEAFNDGLLEIDEVEKIQQIQRQMAEIQEALALGEYETVLQAAGIQFSASGLTSESFRNLQDELDTASTDAAKSIRENYAKTQQALDAAYAGGAIGKSEYEKESGLAYNKARSNIAEIELKKIEFELNSIIDAFGSESLRSLGTILDKYTDYDWEVNPLTSLLTVMREYDVAKQNDQKAIEQFLESISDEIASVEAIEKQWESLSPEARSRLTSTKQALETLQQMAKNPQYNSANDIYNVVMGDNQYGHMQGIVADMLGSEVNKELYERNRQALTSFKNPLEMALMGSLNDRYDLSGADIQGGSPKIEYSPTLQFYGGAPSTETLNDALGKAQLEFDSLMDKYLKNKRRITF